VGFLVHSLKSFTCNAFKCYFHLWGNGGPHWRSEFKNWQLQCQQEWTLVSPNKGRTDKSLDALKKFLKNSILKRKSDLQSVSRKLSFATFQYYEACAGYECPTSSEDVVLALQAGYDFPQIRRRAGVLFSPSVSVSDSKIPVGSIVTFGSFQSGPNILSSVEKGECSNSSQVLGAADPISNPLANLLPHPTSSPVNNSAGFSSDGPKDQAFDKPVVDLAFEVWKCSRCLSFAHDRSMCTNDIRCRSCFHYGHIRKNFLAAKNKKIWVQTSGKSG
jgi:hypothetical protein